MAESRAERMDLRQMGIWGRQVAVQFGDRHEEVWLQTIGDRTEALERGHEAMQQKLVEFRPGGERSEAMTEALKLAPVQDVVGLVLRAERAQMDARLGREMPDRITPRRDRAAGESEEKFARRQAEHDECCRALALARTREAARRLEARREELLAVPREKLAELALPHRIDMECWNAFARTCDDWVLLRAVRCADDHDRPYFGAVAEVQALHSAVKEQLRSAYRELEPAQEEALPKSSAAAPSSGSTT